MTSGFSSILANAGSIVNRGVELGVNTTPVKTQNFQWDLGFNYTYNKDSISIIPFLTKTILDSNNLSINTKIPPGSGETFPEQSQKINRRLMYFKKRYGLKEIEMLQFFHQYRHIPQTRVLIEKAFKEFIRINRMKGIKSTEFWGIAFLNEIQELIIKLYRTTKMGEILPNGYPIIV